MPALPTTRQLRTIVFAAAACAVLAAAPTAARSGTQKPASLPASLTDAEFWNLITDISEPGGYFRITDNYTSNEADVGVIVSSLRERKISGGVYVGVGPEQNFSYIAAIRPAMAFVIDIRRQAVMQHLMFKSIFEFAKDRADFISLLFARPKPKGLEAAAGIQAMWEAFIGVPVDQALAEATKARVVQHLTKTKKFALTEEELAQLDNVLWAFVQFGPGITTRGSMQGRGGGSNVTFADLTGWAADHTGAPQSFLSSEEHFQTVKALHDRNLIVPVSGDFGGPKALRAIGSWIRARNATLTAFYVSNVEQYLFQDFKQQAFYDSLSTFPLTDTSVFIRPYAVRRNGTAAAICPIAAFLKAVRDGRVQSNNDATACAGY